MSQISLELLMEKGAHYGHITPKKHPMMDKYIHKVINGTNVIDLRKTLTNLQLAHEFTQKIASTGGKLLFVGTKNSIKELIKEKAVFSDNFYVNLRWLGGTLTNFQTVKQSIIKLNNIEKIASVDLSYPDVIKKEAVLYEKQRKKLIGVLAGIRNMRKMPVAVIVVDILLDQIAIKECKVLGIPIIAITDSNTNPSLVDYPVPANDDSIDTIELFLDVINDAYLTGRNIYLTKDHQKKIDEAANKQNSAKSKAQKKTAEKADLKGENLTVPKTEIEKEPTKEAEKLPKAEVTQKSAEKIDLKIDDKKPSISEVKLKSVDTAETKEDNIVDLTKSEIKNNVVEKAELNVENENLLKSEVKQKIVEKPNLNVDEEKPSKSEKS